MVSSTLIVAAMGAALPVAFATPSYPVANGTTPSGPTSTGGSKPALQTVAVGQNGLKFTPDTITAKVGEQIVFEFFPKNHAVVQANFDSPCKPKDGGIFSGFVPVPEGRANKTFVVTVQDDKPMWLYCPQNAPMPHCPQGMVAVINPPASGPNTLDAFKAAAAATNGTNATAPSGGPTGGEVSTPGAAPGTPGAPGSPSSSPAPSLGSATSATISGFLGLAALSAAILL
ncbi:unnamed protein product [Periconia digitata]|uniref:Cupredoxin n=1 Tax=Periconia digitata TaxID=1303443 RepID=A0A9W4XFL8_9PLEO|nr:unnamed protein product [Periconia digitata]